MPYVADLYFDSEGEAAIRQIWREMAESGICSRMLRMGGRPHISLAAYDALDLVTFEPAIREFARQAHPVKASFATVDSFPDGTLFLAPTITDDLRALFECFHQVFQSFAASLQGYYRPEAWHPHCSVALELEGDALARGFALARRAPLPIEVQLREVGLVEIHPVRALLRHTLQGLP